MQRFEYLATIEAAVEHPEYPRTYLVSVVSRSGVLQLCRMPEELFKQCATRITPHEPVWVYGFDYGDVAYLTHFLPEVFHRETPDPRPITLEI